MLTVADDEILACTWHVRSARGADDPWYPSSSWEVPRLAAVVCGRCPRRAACLTEALLRPEDEGIWAGLPPGRRRRLQSRILMGHDRGKVVAEGLSLADRLRGDHSRRSERA